MKRVVMVVVLCATMVLSLSENTEAQRKKKGKEPELAISKRGKLIFEDDFSEKELEWNVVYGNWKIEKKALVTNSKSTGNATVAISRPFMAVPDLICQFRIILPQKVNLAVQTIIGPTGPDNPRATLSSKDQVLALCYDSEGARVDLAMHPFVYPKPRWLDATFELFAGKCALTVDKKTIRAEIPATGTVNRNVFHVFVYNPDGEMVAIDDVKVYEALPKDEDKNDKDEKKKK